jgi:hypothetical protein
MARHSFRQNNYYYVASSWCCCGARSFRFPCVLWKQIVGRPRSLGISFFVLLFVHHTEAKGKGRFRLRERSVGVRMIKQSRSNSPVQNFVQEIGGVSCASRCQRTCQRTRSVHNFIIAVTRATTIERVKSREQASSCCSGHKFVQGNFFVISRLAYNIVVSAASVARERRLVVLNYSW